MLTFGVTWGCFCMLCVHACISNFKSPALSYHPARLHHSDDSQDEDYKSRWRSIRVMYFTMFLSSVGEDAHQFELFYLINVESLLQRHFIRVSTEKRNESVYSLMETLDQCQ